MSEDGEGIRAEGPEGGDEPSEESPALELRGLEKAFRQGMRRRRVHALRGADLTVRRGEIFGYLGPNGAGKTTSMKIALGLIQPTAGEVRVLGGSIDEPEVRSAVGYLPEHPSFYDYLSAAELLDFYARLFGLGRRERGRRVEELLGRVGLAEVGDRAVRRFSKGMLQRVGIAQALINDPELVVLDEPLTGLDPMGRREVRDLILELREEGKTIFFSTHILHDLEILCDRVGLILDGRVARVAPLEELGRGGGGAVEIVAAGGEAGLREALEGVVDSLDRVGGGLRVRVAEPSAERALRTLLDHGATVTNLQPVRESLEDFFLRQAGEEQVG